MSFRTATKALKSAGRAISNIAKGDFSDAWMHGKRAAVGVYKSSPGYHALASAAKFIRPEVPEISSGPDVGPTARPETGKADRVGLRSRRRGTGRAGTVVAGDLIPTDMGHKSLLG
ncbi:MAG: hypothetical protein GY941_21685 [Planctomycetes bacterium]|nr:hypothetical protein [Planctomycetota bacterium]